MNMLLHGIDKPSLWHGNTLTGAGTYEGLFEGAPPAFDVILTDPPFGRKEGKEAQTGFEYKTTRTPEELMDIIEAKGREIAEALATLRATMPPKRRYQYK